MSEEPNIFKERVFTVTEIAAMMKVSYTLARQLIHENKIKIVKVGKQILVPESEARKLLELRKRKVINKKFGSGGGS
jgi:excisionase family DNA binding protein